MPPYGLPDNQTQSGIKSRSSKGGSGANYNEIRFEDKMGSEELLIHAEKQQTIEVEADESHCRITSYNVCYTKLLRKLPLPHHTILQQKNLHIRM